MPFLLWRLQGIGMVPAGEIEEAVRGYLQQLVSTPEIIAATYRHAVTQEREILESLQREIEMHAQHLRNLRIREKELQNAPTPENLVALQDIMADIAEATAAVQRVTRDKQQWEAFRISEAEVKDALGRLDEIWKVLIPAEQAAIMQCMVERITIDGDGLQVNLRTDGIHTLVSELGRHVVKDEVREQYV